MSEGPEVEDWPVERLLLDSTNPRLPESLGERDQLTLLRFFEQEYDLEELGWSMAEKGYFNEEPLLTVTDPTDESRRIVIEGNRRLATLRLLIDTEARTAIGKPLWSELAEFAADHQLASVPTRNYASKAELLEYLGFRHVSGLLQWSADAKARFVHTLVTEHEYTFQKAARVIGSRQDALRRQFIAWRCLEQGRARGLQVDRAVEHFGVFYRALQNPRNREFLKLDGWIDGTEETLEPLKEDGPERLAEFISFIFGGDSQRRVVRESRQLDDLGRVLADPRATALLREEGDINLALQELPADRDAVYAAIRLAYRQAARANAEAWQFAGDGELQEQARRLRGVVDQLIKVLEQQPAAASDAS